MEVQRNLFGTNAQSILPISDVSMGPGCPNMFRLAIDGENYEVDSEDDTKDDKKIKQDTSGRLGKLILVNDGDANNNGTIDRDDNTNGVATLAGNVVPMTMSFNNQSCGSTCTSASLQLSWDTTALRLWKGSSSGYSIMSPGTYDSTYFGLPASGGSATIQVEGLKESSSVGDQSINGGFGGLRAEVKWTVIEPVDIDTDSDNDRTISRSAQEESVEVNAGAGKELIFGVPSDVTLETEEPEAIAEIIVSASRLSLSNPRTLRLTAGGGLNIWLDSRKTQPLGTHNADPSQPDVFVFDSSTFTGEKRLYVEGNLEGLDLAITIELVSPSGKVDSQDKILFSVEEYIDIRPIEKLANLNAQIGQALAGDALQYLTQEEYDALKAAGLYRGRYDGLWDYVFLEIGGNYYTYIEPTLYGSYRLFAIAPNTVSILSLRQGAEIANWLVALNATDVSLSVLPGGTSAGFIEQGDYARAAVWFVADVGLTLSVVGKLGQVTAKVGSVVKSGSAIRLGKALNNVGKIGQYRNVVLGGTIATGILGAESGAGAVSDVLKGKYTSATIKALDAVFAALGVSSQARQYRDALTDATKAEKKLAEKVDLQQVAGQTGHRAVSPGRIAPDEWCFAPTTLVSTAFGRRPINEIEANDQVYAFDFDTRKYVLAKVLKRHNNSFNGNFVTITLSSGDKIEVTTNHLIWVLSGNGLNGRDAPPHDGIRADEGKLLAGRWLNSQDVRKGDKLHSRGEKEIEVTSIESRLVNNQPVCNLTIEGYHNYSVTDAELLAHNDPSWCDILVSKGMKAPEKLLEIVSNLGLDKSWIHGHHIVMKNADDAASVAARQILFDYGVPLLKEKADLQAATEILRH